MLNLKLWHKLALALILAMGVLLVSTLLLLNKEFDRGFIEYINTQANRTLSLIKTRIEDDYDDTIGWSHFARSNEEINNIRWNIYIRKAIVEALNAVDYQLDENSCRQLENPLSSNKKRNYTDYSAPFDSPVNAEQSRLAAQTRVFSYIALIDKSKNVLVGRWEVGDNDNLHKLTKNKKTIGYLYAKPFEEPNNELDQKFARKQKQVIFYLLLIMAGFSVLFALGFSTYLKRRIKPLSEFSNELTKGNYQHRIEHNNQDELGKLGRDLTVLSQTLDATQHERRKWIADISHELRTPLAVLKGELEAIEDGIRPMNMTSIQSLCQEVDHLNLLVNDLHQLSMADTGALTYNMQKLNLSRTLAETLSVFTTRYTDQGLSLSSTIEPSLCIMADSLRIKQLLTNLCENSARYTHAPGEVHIACLLEDGQCTLIIEDSAPGVPETDIHRIFERLYRIEHSRNRATGGSGLGLSLAKSIIDAHNGSITASTSDLGGLKLELKFPLS